MNNQVLAMTQKVMRHMAHHRTGQTVGGILLTGDPGIGKTTFVNILSKLLGIKSVVIEVPHITEEHVINIPFIVYNPKTGQRSGMSDEVPANDYKLVLAHSHLYTQLTSAQPMSDQEYLQKIQRSSGVIQQLYQAFGGTPEQIPPAIHNVREQYKTILFLDEYFRQSSQRIRNILRGILNNRIGLHTIPRSTYIMYASNMKDTGLDEIPSNTQFQAVKYKAPTAQEWFQWFTAEFGDNPRVKLNKAVMQKFSGILHDEDISFTDVAADVRTSPRRWTQILLMLNSSLPVENKSEAQALLTNVKNNFINHETNQFSGLAAKVMEAVTELIQETSGMQVDQSDTLPDHEWRGALEHLMVQQMKLGEHRQHIPVVSGAPGIGKTREMVNVARRHNLRLIDIDMSEYFADDAIGLPLPGESDEAKENLSIHFSVPKLAQHINNVIKEKDEQYVEALKSKYGDDAKRYIDQYKAQEWKYLVFLDEINRVDEKTFNAFRRIILEKNFGPKGDGSGELLKLPEGSIVVAAMNPDPEAGGTTQLTQHFRDVIDIVNAAANWDQMKKILMTREFEGVDEDVKTAAMNIMEEFADKFKHRTENGEPAKYPRGQERFHLDVGSDLYVAPREYDAMFTTLVRELDHAVKSALSNNLKPEQIKDRALNAIADSMQDSLNFIFHKHRVDEEEFMDKLQMWVNQLNPALLGGLLTKTVKTRVTLGDHLATYLKGDDIAQMPEDADIVNTNSALNNSQFIDEVKQAISNVIVDDASARKYILDETHPRVIQKGDALGFDPKEKVSHLMNFVFGLLYTLHIHEFQNDRLAVIGKALNGAVSEALKGLSKNGKLDDDIRAELSEKIVNLRSDIHRLVKSL